ncbi:hypothetical protein MRX96_027698 [Rhipicephalus microplus]
MMSLSRTQTRGRRHYKPWPFHQEVKQLMGAGHVAVLLWCHHIHPPMVTRRIATTAPPPVPPRRASPTNTPGQSPGTSPRHQTLFRPGTDEYINGGAPSRTSSTPQSSPENSGTSVTYSEVQHDTGLFARSSCSGSSSNPGSASSSSSGCCLGPRPSSSFPPTIVTVAPSPPNTNGTWPGGGSSAPLQRAPSPLPAPSIHYAELAELFEEPSYANTELSAATGLAANPVPRQTEPSSLDSLLCSPLPGSANGSVGTSQKIEKRLRMLRPLGTSALENKENDRVSYENLHMDYISELTSEGYAQDAVIRALGIARNDLQMARDILHEFAGKNK